MGFSLSLSLSLSAPPGRSVSLSLSQINLKKKGSGEARGGSGLLRVGRWPAGRWELLGGLQTHRRERSRKVACVGTSLIPSFPWSGSSPTKPDALPSGVAVEGLYHLPETPA